MSENVSPPEFTPAPPKNSPLASAHLTNGLVWGFDFLDGAAIPVTHLHVDHDAPSADGFRWLHFNAVDHGAERSITAMDLPVAVRDLLLGHDDHQCALVDGGYAAGVLHDYERRFEGDDSAAIGSLRFAINNNTLLTVRKQPLRCADVVKRRINGGVHPTDAASALDLLVSSITEVMVTVLHELEIGAERVEDELLTDSLTPDTRELVAMRRRAVQLHRLLAGLGSICQRLESDDALERGLLPAIEKFSQRVNALHHNVSALQSQLRLLRDELELQAAQRTNRSLYVLSILSALMLPATFVTGLFGMNTGGLPWASAPLGTLAASIMAILSAAGVYLVLRKLGFAKV